MRDRRSTWLTTEEAAAQVGFTSQWIRRQVASGRLKATVYLAGKRRTYKIRGDDWDDFLRRYARTTDDPDWD